MQYGKGVKETKSRQPRRNAEQLQSAIAAAVMAEFAQGGYRGVTFEGVARRARTSKPVLYRRFPSRIRMVVFALLNEVKPLIADIPLNQGLAAGLHAAARTLATRAQEVGVPNIVAMMSELTPETRKIFASATTHPGLAHIEQLYRREVAAGRLSERVLSETFIRFPLVLMMGEILTCGEVDSEALEELIDAIVIPALVAA